MQECDLELINEAVYEYISQYVDPQDILKNEPMSRHTTFCVGGEAGSLFTGSAIRNSWKS